MAIYLVLLILVTQQLLVCTQNTTSAEDVSSSLINNETFSDTTSMQVVSPTPSVLEKWKHFENVSRIFAKGAVKRLLPLLMDGSGGMNISSSCMKDVMKFIAGLRNIKPWAFSFLDASGKFIDGMLDGTLSVLGEFDQCLDIKAIDDRRGKNKNTVMFTGKYCALDIRPPLPPKRRYYKIDQVLEELKNFSEGGNIISETAKIAHFFHFLAMRVGICIPSGCQESDVAQVIKIVEEDTQWSVNVKRCEVKEENVYPPLVIAVLTFYSFFGFMMLIGTMLELYYYYAQKKIKALPLQVLTAFSLKTSFTKLVNTKSSAGNMSCLHGVRVCSITWIILGHTYLNVNYQLFRGLKRATVFQKDFAFQAVVNATVAVDTFFFIGGLLLCYVTIKVVRTTKKPLNIGLYLLHRVIRILPIYTAVVVVMFIAPLFGSGPVWHDSIDPFVNACYKNWWTNLLFINNFVNTNEMCLPQSWYIASDMQLYIAALIILLPLIRWPKVGLSLCFLGIVASVVGTGIMTYVKEYPPTMLFVHPDHEQRISYWANAYFKPYSHAGPYCIGLLIGYLLATKPNYKFSMKVRLVGWCCAVACNMSILYGVWEWNKGQDPTVFESVAYSSLHRVGWALGVAWVVVNCIYGQAGVVNYILSWKCWIPIGRLTYAAYLIHPIVQMAAVGNVRMKLQTAHWFAVWMFFGHLMITYGISFVTSMLVEAPFISLEKLIFRTPKPPTNANTNGRIQADEWNRELKINNVEQSGELKLKNVEQNGKLKMSNVEQNGGLRIESVEQNEKENTHESISRL